MNLRSRLKKLEQSKQDNKESSIYIFIQDTEDKSLFHKNSCSAKYTREEIANIYPNDKIIFITYV